jgi:tRNA U34 2-thiouridine synthase MnmA/TrmU
MKKAIVLISGGLDSALAAKLIKEQGIEIMPLNFLIPFCHRDKNTPSEEKQRWLTDSLGVPAKVIDISDDFLAMLRQPKHGFGSNINPCIDCKILMLRRAKELMQDWGAAFVVTGEVLGQRPMSQYRRALNIIERESGLEGLVLRPLSAKLLPETTPEKEGWVNRNRLLDFQGRSRRPQMTLADSFHIRDYPNAAGGCLLTDPEFSKRLKDLMQCGELNINNIELLKLGRHFRLNERVRLVVGRDEKENAELLRLAKDNDYLLFPNAELAGPTSLGRGEFNADLIMLASSITCRYCDLNGRPQAEIIYRRIPETEENRIKASAIFENELNSLRI